MFKNANSKKEKKIHIAGIHHFSWGGGGVAEEGGGRGGQAKTARVRCAVYFHS